MTIPEEAIEAAAEALAHMYGNGDLAVIYQDDARTAIEAAMPAIREAIAQEIEADTVRMDDGRLNTFNMGAQHAARIVRTIAVPPAECDNGQANTCRHDSASGMDASFGPGKVWRCDHCGLCWIEGYSPHDVRGGTP